MTENAGALKKVILFLAGKLNLERKKGVHNRTPGSITLLETPAAVAI
jgi:hypothetical protein